MARLGAVMAGMDIRWTAGQQQPIEPVEQRADIDLRPDRRDQYRQTPRGIDHRIRIFLVYPVEDSLFDRAEAAGDADERHVVNGHRRLNSRLILAAPGGKRIVIYKQLRVERHPELCVKDRNRRRLPLVINDRPLPQCRRLTAEDYGQTAV